MPNLRGASSVGRDDGGPLYAARAGSKGASQIGDVDGVWRGGMTHSRSGVAGASRPRKGQGASSPLMGVGQMVLTMGGGVSLGKLSRKTLVRRRRDFARLSYFFFYVRERLEWCVRRRRQAVRVVRKSAARATGMIALAGSTKSEGGRFQVPNS